MILEFSDAQELLRGRAEDFATQVVASAAPGIDESDRIPAELIRQAASLGLTAIALPAVSGGGGHDDIATLAALEALARASAAVALIVGLNHLVARVVDRFGTPSQRERWFQGLIDGNVRGAVVVGDQPLSSSQASDGIRVRNIRATWVANLQSADLALFVEPGLRSDVPGDVWLLSMADVGIRREDRHDPLGLRGAGWADAMADGYRLDPVTRLGWDAAASGEATEWIRHQACVLSAAVAIGVGRAALAHAAAYIKAQPEGGSQAARFALADAATELDAAWMLALKAASEAEPARPLSASMAKLLATEAAGRTCGQVMQLTAPADTYRGSTAERL